MLSELIMTDADSLMELLKVAGNPVESPDTPLTEEQKKALMTPKKTSIKAQSNDKASDKKSDGTIAVKIIRKEKTILTQSKPKKESPTIKPVSKQEKQEKVSEEPSKPKTPEKKEAPKTETVNKTKKTSITINESIIIEDLAKKTLYFCQ